MSDETRVPSGAIERERVEYGYWPNYAGLLNLAPIPGLDKGIAPWVQILRMNRVETYESCDGGDGHSYPEPTIAFHGGPSAGAHAYHIARTYGLPVDEIRRVWVESDHELTGPQWQITFRRAATAADARDVEESLAFIMGDGRVPERPKGAAC